MRSVYAIAIALAALIALLGLGSVASRGGQFKRPQDVARQLLNEAMRYYHLYEQDGSVLQRAIHVTYADAYVRAATHFADTNALNAIAQRDVGELRQTLRDACARASDALLRTYPSDTTTRDMLRTGYIAGGDHASS